MRSQNPEPVVPPAATPSSGRPAGRHDQLAQFAALSTIFDALDIIVYVSDLQTHALLYLNAKAEKAFGADWRQKRCYQFLQAGQSSPCSFCTNAYLVKDGVAQPPYTWEFRNTINRRWYLCIDQAIPWVDGRLVRMEAAVDITERKQLEKFREQYVGLVAHDLGNPLNSLLLLAKTLERPLGAPAREREREVLGRMVGNARRMESMIRDLHESVRLESSSLALHHERLDLVALTEALLELLSPEEQQRVRLRVEARPALVYGDGPRLQRVLQNLISNAMHHAPHSSAVEVVISRAGGSIEVSVSDDGPGIPAEHVPHLFERGFRVPGTKVEGLGLGLYISRLIIEGHGGRIEAVAGLPRGAQFRFSVPAA